MRIVLSGGKCWQMHIAESLEMICGAQTFLQRWQALTHCMTGYGADQLNYGILDSFNYNFDDAPVSFISTMPSDWIAYYGERRFDLDDPHVKFVREGRLSPYKWGGSALALLDDEAERLVVAETMSAGLKAQLSVILPDARTLNRPIGGLTIGSSLNEAEYFRAISGREGDLAALAMMFHLLSIGEVRREQAGAVPLSIRERDCLSYVALGMRTVRIAEKLGLSEVTIELHLRNARRKLRAATTAQAVARAITFGDISI